MSDRAKRNNVLAGGFLVGTMVLGVWMAFLLAERGPGMDATRFVVRFPLSVGAAGLQEGSNVTLGGQSVGQVTGVTFGTGSGGTGPAESVDVAVAVRREVVLFEDAQVTLEKPLLGTLSSINIVSPGVGAGEARAGTTRLERGEVIEASGAPPGFLAQAGFGPEQVEQVQNILRSLDKSVADVQTLVAQSGPEVHGALEEVRTLVGEARTSFGVWDQRVRGTLADVDEAAGRLGPLMDSAQAAVDEGNRMFAEARAVVSENRGRVDDIMASVARMSDRLEGESLPALNDALTEARDAMDSAGLALAQVRALVEEQSPEVRRTLANARLMSEQLKLTSVEVRSQPWRLLHTPDTKELESQVIYDAARSYAQAASDVRAASEALGAVASSPGADAGTMARVAELSRALARSMERFQQAEQELLEELVGR